MRGLIVMNKSRWTSLCVAATFGIAACSKEPAPVQNAAAPTSSAPAATTDANTAALASNTGAPIPIKVYKDPNCGCCKEWVKHLEANGFKVETMDMPDLSLLKQKYAVTPEIQSCHTAVVGNYVVEGHVPADLIKKMLKEKPAIAGLSVPGMVTGSPGMEGATKERYNVLTFDRAGRTTVYAQR